MSGTGSCLGASSKEEAGGSSGTTTSSLGRRGYSIYLS